MEDATLLSAEQVFGYVAECTLGWDEEPDDYNVAFHRAEQEVGSPHSRGRGVARDGVQFCVTEWADSPAQSPRSPAARKSFTSP